jgi:hypothetical protein
MRSAEACARERAGAGVRGAAHPERGLGVGEQPGEEGRIRGEALLDPDADYARCVVAVRIEAVIGGEEDKDAVERVDGLVDARGVGRGEREVEQVNERVEGLVCGNSGGEAGLDMLDVGVGIDVGGSGVVGELAALGSAAKRGGSHRRSPLD